eukprot:3432435-Pyramimonas_sp.AAC.1
MPSSGVETPACSLTRPLLERFLTDGSCLKPGGHKQYNVAGWSVVAIHGHGDVFAYLIGRV